MPHFITNRGKLLLAQGAWDDEAAGNIFVGLLSAAAIPTGIDTEAEIQDLNSVNDLLAISGADEPVGAWYSRLALSRISVVEDDVNNRAQASLTDPTWVNATAGVSLYGAFIFREAGADTADELISVILFASVVVTNGGNLSLDFTGIYNFT